MVNDINSLELIKDIFGIGSDRNDLSITVKNETNENIVIDPYIKHGETKRMNPMLTIKPNGYWGVSIHADGEGSNVGMSITFPDSKAFALMAATPDDKKNYLKASHSDAGYHSGKTAWDAAEKHKEHPATDNVLIWESGHVQLNATISVYSKPAVCEVVISSSKP